MMIFILLKICNLEGLNKNNSVSLGENQGGLKPGGEITWRLIHALVCHRGWNSRGSLGVSVSVGTLYVHFLAWRLQDSQYSYIIVSGLSVSVSWERWLSRSLWPSLKIHSITAPCLTGWRNDEGPPSLKGREHRFFFLRVMWMSHCWKSMWHWYISM